MTPKEQLVEALRVLCRQEGGYVPVADKIGVNDQTLHQIARGVKLPSGEPKGVGPTLQKKLEAHYPGWSQLREPHRGGSRVRQESPPYVATSLDAAVQAIARHLERLTPTRRAELLQVFTLLIEHPDEPDYVARFTKLLAAAEGERGKRRAAGA